MFLGMGVVGTGLLAWYFAQFRIHKRDSQTCKYYSALAL